MKLLSVIIPIYNAEKWLSEALDSLVAQTYDNIEIICVDDGSVDGSRGIIQTYSNHYPQIKLVHQENSGVSAARNRGIMEAAGDYIAFLDADDYVENDMYEKMIAQMEQENSDIVFCSFVRFWPNGKVQYTHEENFSKLISNPGDIQYFLYSTPPQKENDHLYTKDIHGSVCRSVFIRTIIIQHCIRFNLELSFAEDQIFMLDYLNCCRNISWCPNPFLHYRGWTKTPKYHGYYDNHMLLVRNQKRIVSANGYYSPAQKRRIISYLECSAYFAIIKEVFEYRVDSVEIMKKYSTNYDFNRLLSLRGIFQKYRIHPDFKRIILFLLLKLRMWTIVKAFFPGKKY